MCKIQSLNKFGSKQHVNDFQFCFKIEISQQKYTELLFGINKQTNKQKITLWP